MMPGRTLHRLATHICSAKTLERVVEPAIADLQKEYAGADRVWRRAWVLLTGYIAIVKVIAICAVTISPVSDHERRELVRALVWSGAMFLVIGILLTALPMYTHSHGLRRLRAMSILAQAVPLAIPLGIAFGLAFGLSARVTTNLAKIALVGALTASTLSLCVLVWVMPAAHQSFTESALRQARSRGYDGPARTSFQKGHSQMSVAELRAAVAHFSADGEPRIARRYAFGLHQRFSLAAASVAFASMLLVLRADARAVRGGFALVACVIYWVLMFTGEWGSRRGYLALPLGAWLPNIVLIACAILVACSRSSRSSRLRGSLRAAR
jgi:hypothetical protein